MKYTFYDFEGKAVSYIDNDEIIYLFEGKPVGYFENDAVHSIAGHHLGWFEDGWVRDLRGRRVFFTESATGKGPVPPAKHTKPVKGAKQPVKTKGDQHSKKMKPPISSSWSALSGEMYFYQ
ncbi:MAG: hypothetical protein JW904_11405 [Spirochaetales bacterium]|nr:hypothetical protein [Spirochaetales bacterium]